MRVAVVTPYYKEPLEVLKRCHDSVRAQIHHKAEHILVADGHPRPELDAWDAQHISIPASDDCGDTPRLVGAVIASTSGVDAIAFLDADNWFEPDHLATLVTMHELTGHPIVTATRFLRRLDGGPLGVCTESDGQAFTDTNCYLLMRPAFHLLGAWGFKERGAAALGDRVFWRAVVRSGLARAHSTTPTVNYVTSFAGHYLAHGETPPPESKGFYRPPGEKHLKTASWADIQKMNDAEKPQ